MAAYDGEFWSIIARHIVRLLSLPVFTYLPREDTEVSRDDLEHCVKVLAWTGPFAAVVLNRCIQSAAGHSVLQEPWEDSVTLKEAEDAIVTDVESEADEEAEDAIVTDVESEADEEAEDAIVTDVESEADDGQTSSAMVPTHVSNTYIPVASCGSQEARNDAAVEAVVDLADMEANVSEEDGVERELPADKDEEVAATIEQPETNMPGGKELAATHEVSEVDNDQPQGEDVRESDLAEMLQFTMDAVTAADISD
ncbi:hypothetical protein QFC22_006495 [Naganishia vaughanmartiniae]|uniref:Uncharacterized protein n=1 Tax=Naganishia vaughanmartiniae TaxID=1424756 RepID=A0ACC2WJ90_9TREE|nr:hypothetical protein QFC22_006495 [Naganishia vaughanmartiniae]